MMKIKYRGGKGTVLLGEVLGRHLDGSREVTSLAHSQDHTTGQEQPHRDGGQGNDTATSKSDGTPSAGCMHTGTHAPHEDGNEVALLGAHPVDKLTSKEVGHSIEHREQTRNGAVIIVRPMKVRGDKIFPCQTQHLTVHVVNGSRKEEQSADNPAETTHFGCLD